jgi:NAD-dependent dihydropyrimidine dehydrogenase PreA subunit
MAYVITDACVGVKDAGCVEVCPVDCIHPTPNEPGFGAATQLYINPDECIGCGVCAGVCPVHAIFPDDDLPAEKEQFVQINAAWFRRK